jgi:hypothetical protein
LTLEAGVVVFMNHFYIQINGTLAANGSTNEQIGIFDGTLNFTSACNGWNEATDSGCILENANLTGGLLTSSVTLKIESSFINSASLSGSSVVYSSVISTLTLNNGAATISNSKIGTLNILGGNPVISQNSIEFILGSGTASPQIFKNSINSIG